MKDKIFENAKDFNEKGMKYYVENDMKHSLLNIAVAAELLGKAFLSGINPCLIVDKDFDSMLHVCGEGKHARKSPGNIRTVGAKEVFNRCIQILPKLKDYEAEMILLADFRSGVLHLAEHEKEFVKKVFSPYLKFVKILCEAMNISMSDYFGEFHKLVDVSIKESTKQINIDVERSITKAKIDFQERFEGLEEVIKKNIVKSITDGYVLDKYDEALFECPVCKNDGVVAGTFHIETWDVDFDRDGNPEGAYPVGKLYATSFNCNVCGLKLNTSEELEAAGIDTVVGVENIDPTDFYEPDFDDIGD